MTGVTTLETVAPGFEYTIEDGITYLTRYQTTEAVEWSDPRLGSELLNELNLTQFPSGEVTFAGIVRAEGPDGHWTGNVTGFIDTDGESTSQNLWTGHGDYEGHYAIVNGRGRTEADGGRVLEYDGAIFAGAMPAFPAPPIE